MRVVEKLVIGHKGSKNLRGLVTFSSVVIMKSCRVWQAQRDGGGSPVLKSNAGLPAVRAKCALVFHSVSNRRLAEPESECSQALWEMQRRVKRGKKGGG